MSSTVVTPLMIASEKQTVLRIDVGRTRSLITTENPLL